MRYDRSGSPHRGYGRSYDARMRQGQRGRGYDAEFGPAPTVGYTDYSQQGRYGGHRGAHNLRPMMAGGYDAELRGHDLRGRERRGYRPRR